MSRDSEDGESRHDPDAEPARRGELASSDADSPDLSVSVSPLPSAEDLRRLDTYQSGLGREVIDMVKAEQASRHEESRRQLDAQDRRLELEQKRLELKEKSINLEQRQADDDSNDNRRLHWMAYSIVLIILATVIPIGVAVAFLLAPWAGVVIISVASGLLSAARLI
ncbi:DUF2335 domain-containing protein [Halorhodospira halophila]|uniref:Transmembrane protein n=1 Tax=Halorhodospira halophila (strain DSM 244 / SL1) TaxID=349124 RepID=A1WV01_HALHL|nr:DUF2335 domain-containing protein [Halorhodospira halophila]ABM61513.1 hypothetical protein Hhal_0731 [Halorhodospira halophila SL1]MBK1728761.1 DUF2335 domain-containing protein [Halorhodospira halophila]